MSIAHLRGIWVMGSAEAERYRVHVVSSCNTAGTRDARWDKDVAIGSTRPQSAIRMTDAGRDARRDPHRYRYELVAEGVGREARFTARAIGDVDCDGVYSTFERTGAADAEGHVYAATGRWVNEGE